MSSPTSSRSQGSRSPSSSPKTPTYDLPDSYLGMISDTRQLGTRQKAKLRALMKETPEEVKIEDAQFEAPSPLDFVYLPSNHRIKKQARREYKEIQNRIAQDNDYEGQEAVEVTAEEHTNSCCTIN